MGKNKNKTQNNNPNSVNHSFISKKTSFNNLDQSDFDMKLNLNNLLNNNNSPRFDDPITARTNLKSNNSYVNNKSKLNNS